MEKITLEEATVRMKAQGSEDIMGALFECPRCKLAQSGNDLVRVGAGKDLEEINGFLGFSCIGRWAEDEGCDWTLGGLFQVHGLEIDGRPTFRILTKEEAEEHNGR